MNVQAPLRTSSTSLSNPFVDPSEEPELPASEAEAVAAAPAEGVDPSRAWTHPVPNGDVRLPASGRLAWEDKDTFVRLNGQRRWNNKAVTATVVGGIGAYGTLAGGLITLTAGVAALPILFGTTALCDGVVASFYRAHAGRKPKPDGLRKYLFSDFDEAFSRRRSEQVVQDLKIAAFTKPAGTAPW